MASVRKYELNLSKAQDICRLYNLEIPSRIIRFEKGMVNDVFSLDKKYVIKINTGDPEIIRFHKEKAIYDLLNKNNIPSPKVYVYDNSKKLIPYTFIVMEYIDGVPLGSIWSSLSRFAKNKLLLEIGKLLAKIHRIHFTEFGDQFSRGKFVGVRNYKQYIVKHIKKIIRGLKGSKVSGEEKIERIKNYFEQTKIFNIKIKGSLLTGNFSYDNIIIKDNKIKAIVDWEWAKSAHNEEEVATFIYRVLHMNENETKLFRKGYEKVLKLDKDFKNRFYVYNLLYYLSVLPYVPRWKHRPDKQKEYFREVDKLLNKVIK